MNFYSTLENAKGTLVQMKARLDRYKAKPSPSEAYIRTSEENIAHLSNFITTAENEFEGATFTKKEELAESLNRGIEIGRREAENHINYGRGKLYDLSSTARESVRAASKSTAMMKWPELY
jgi:hypothetical protein